MPVAVQRPAPLKLKGDGIPTLLHVDPKRPGQEQYGIHTRWHPDIPCIANINAGETYRVECLDYSGGQVGNHDDVQDVKDLNHDT